jgi:hypothetical protein
VARTADDPTAAISSIVMQSVAADDEYLSLYVDFVSTQTYLEEDNRSGLHSDLQVLTSLWDGVPSSTTAAPSRSGSASAGGSSLTATPRTQTSVSTAVVVKTRSIATAPTSTGTSAAAATGGVAGAPAVNGVVAGAFAGFVAVVGLL